MIRSLVFVTPSQSIRMDNFNCFSRQNRNGSRDSPLYQTEAERLLDGLQQFELEPLFGLVAWQVQHVEAGVSHRQELLVAGRLEVELRIARTIASEKLVNQFENNSCQQSHFNRLHALYRNSIAAGQEQQELFLFGQWQLVEHLPEQPDLSNPKPNQRIRSNSRMLQNSKLTVGSPDV